MKLLHTSLLGVVIAVGISDLVQASQASVVVCYPHGNRSKHTCDQTVSNELEKCLEGAESAKKDAMSDSGADRVMQMSHVQMMERGCYTASHEHSALCKKCPDQ